MRRQGIEFPFDYAAGCAVERNPITGLEHLALHSHLASLFDDFNIARSGNAALPHAARDDRGVAGHAAARGQNSGRNFHAVNVFGSGLRAHKNHRILRAAVSRFFDGFIRSENNLPDSSARRCRQSRRQYFNFSFFSSRRGTRKS